MKGLIHIYEGDGKGKTTASIGLCIRCAGNGGRVVFTQFLKDDKSCELNILNTIDAIRYIPCERSFGFYWNMTEEEKIEAKVIYSKHLENVLNIIQTDHYRMLILDEIISAYNLNLIDQTLLLEFLKNKPEHLEVVMTGRNPARELILFADYQSEIIKKKHPYDRGIPARRGIEK